MPETVVLFFAAIVVIACAILITFYSLCRHTHPAPTEKRFHLSNWKGGRRSFGRTPRIYSSSSSPSTLPVFGLTRCT
jgi:hypothetical protein